MKILTNYDFTQNQLLNVALQNLATAPGTPVAGQVYHNTTDHKFYGWDGTAWVDISNIYTHPSTHSADIIVDGTTNHAFTAADDTKLAGIATNANNYSHPTGDGNLHVPVTSTTNNGKVLTAGPTAGSLSWTTPTVGTVTDVSGTSPVVSSGGATPAISIPAATNASAGHATAAHITAIEANTTKITNATHTGDVTGSTALTIANNAVTLAKMADMATASLLGRNTTATGDPEVLPVATVKTMLGLGSAAYTASTAYATSAQGTTADGAVPKSTVTAANDFIVGTGASTVAKKTASEVRTILNVADGANNYVHPSTDGSHHVPATSTTNNTKVLKSGATAGSEAWGAVDWGELTNKPSSTTVNIDSAVSLKHTQNTDTGTSSATFQVGTSGAKIKNNAGTELQVRNADDTDYADVRVRNLVVEGTATTINSNTVNIGDSNIELNSDITTNAQNSDGGITIKRLQIDNVTRADAIMRFNNSAGRWEATAGAVTAWTIITVAQKKTATIGDGIATSFPIMHYLNTRDVNVTIRETGSPYKIVMADIACTDLNTITVSFAVAPTTNQYSVTIIG